MTKKFIGIVPFWPLGTSDSGNYFLHPALVAGKAEYRVSIFALAPNPESRGSFYAGIPLRFFSSPFDLYRSLPQAATIHCQTSCRNIFLILCMLFLRPKNCRVIWTPHTSFGEGYPSNLPVNFFRVFSFVFKRLDRIIAITKYEEKYLKKFGYKNTSCIPLVVDEKKRDLRKATEYKASFNLLFIGGDRSVKGLVGVLKAVSVLGRLRFNVRLTVLGEVGPSFIEEHTDLILPNVKFLGRLEAPSPLLINTFGDAVCYVNNSFYEGPSLAASEAAAAGLFLCLANLPTLRKTFGENARYHKPNNYAQLVRSILYYFYNPKIGKKHAKNNRKLVGNFSYSKFEERFSRLLK